MKVLDSHSAFAFYQSIAHRLPRHPGNSEAPARPMQRAPDLVSIADHFDVFVFDAFGVLNVGTENIAGAAQCIEQLRGMNKQVFVLTNGASSALSSLENKFRQLGFDFSAQEIVSSRHAAEQAVSQACELWSDDTLWGAICSSVSGPADLPVKAIELADAKSDYDRAEAFLFLSSGQWTEARQQLLSASLTENPRPLVLANPDVVAPYESGYTLEPGYFAHRILNQFEQAGRALPVAFFGKPYPAVYQEVMRRIAADVPAHRIAMLGDTLHTDTLGAIVQGWCPVLVSDHGLFRGLDTQPFIQACGLQPEWIIPSLQPL